MAGPCPVLSFRDRTALVPRPVEAPLETVIPFRAWRYSPSAGDLSQLVAPPYDVIGPDLRSRLYARSRHNVVRVDLGMTTPSDNECDNQYTRAADQLADVERGRYPGSGRATLRHFRRRDLHGSGRPAENPPRLSRPDASIRA